VLPFNGRFSSSNFVSLCSFTRACRWLYAPPTPISADWPDFAHYPKPFAFEYPRLHKLVFETPSANCCAGLVA